MTFDRIMMGIKRFWATYKVRSLELELDAKTTALRWVDDKDAFKKIMDARERTKEDLVRERANLTALYPPGTRFTWEKA